MLQRICMHIQGGTMSSEKGYHHFYEKIEKGLNCQTNPIKLSLFDIHIDKSAFFITR